MGWVSRPREKYEIMCWSRFCTQMGTSESREFSAGASNEQTWPRDPYQCAAGGPRPVESLGVGE